ncbi:putative nuclease HARBI1 [Acanthaster planci]|uniref:Nuclease HARBI1 n=1 Tax=Acanthaster planci TaxID=133434 RepID=A0A8B7ZMM0_ACAPL|nr:putative nuclease HARBI1 [Acanthaster planci]
MFNDGRLHGVLIGDTGYPLRQWLMTPILDPTSNAERHYNRCHRRTCVRIEQTIGQLKKKFPCLSVGLRAHPERACRFIRACCVLFNLSKTFGEPEIEEYEPIEDDDHDVIPYNGPLQDGVAHRNRIIDRFF